jgi:hypothetical protein
MTQHGGSAFPGGRKDGGSMAATGAPVAAHPAAPCPDCQRKEFP